MKVVIGETNKGNGEQTVMLDETTGKYYLVSSVYFASMYGEVDETYIFECDKDGEVENWSEVWATEPSNHDGIINMLLSGELSVEDFYEQEDEE